AVGLAVQLDHIKAERSIKRRCDKPAHSVAGIHHDLQTAGFALDAGCNVIAIGLDYTFVAAAPGPVLKVLSESDRLDLLDLRAEDRAFPETDLEAVIVGGIVTAGDHDSGSDIQIKQREVQNRRRHHSHVDHFATGFCQTFDHQVPEPRRALSSVAAQACPAS